MLIDTIRAPRNQSKFIILFTPEALDGGSRTMSEQGKILLSKLTPAKEQSR